MVVLQPSCFVFTISLLICPTTTAQFSRYVIYIVYSSHIYINVQQVQVYAYMCECTDIQSTVYGVALQDTLGWEGGGVEMGVTDEWMCKYNGGLGALFPMRTEVNSEALLLVNQSDKTIFAVQKTGKVVTLFR